MNKLIELKETVPVLEKNEAGKLSGGFIDINSYIESTIPTIGNINCSHNDACDRNNVCWNNGSCYGNGSCKGSIGGGIQLSGDCEKP